MFWSPQKTKFFFGFAHGMLRSRLNHTPNTYKDEIGKVELFIAQTRILISLPLMQEIQMYQWLQAITKATSTKKAVPTSCSIPLCY
jgi:hypothetical protein